LILILLLSLHLGLALVHPAKITMDPSFRWDDVLIFSLRL